eukprot:1178295-Prorocentrum_minimum.AAC.2
MSFLALSPAKQGAVRKPPSPERRREKLNLEDIELADLKPSSAADSGLFSSEAMAAAREALCTSDIYVYIPIKYSKPASDFPICQTYIDCCVVGCLDWGGEAAAEDFIVNTRKIEYCMCYKRKRQLLC